MFKILKRLSFLYSSKLSNPSDSLNCLAIPKTKFFGFFAFAIAKKRTVNFLGGALHLPKSNQIDKPLVIGAMMFGAGWGLAGFCPGPAIVSLASGQIKAAMFVVFMLVGMQVFEVWNRQTSPSK